MSSIEERFDAELSLGGNVFDYEGDMRHGGKAHLKQFLLKEIEQAREEGRKNPDIGVEAVYGFEAGRQVALEEVLEMIEGMKVLYMREEKGEVAYNQSLSDLKQSIEKLKGDK